MTITWHDLTAIVPTPDEVAHHAPALAAAYNDPANAALLANTQALTEADVVEHYRSVAYPFVFLERGALAGDGDLRGVGNGAAEFAFLICAPAAQGKGLGTRFAIMVHAFAFTALALDRIYASVVPENTASRRVFEKLGYAVDETSAYGDDGDIVLRVEKRSFVDRYAREMSEIVIAWPSPPRS
jgi:RimJ/RimL family protein N-acetyltransferase